MKNKRYLCYQLYVVNQETTGSDHNVEINVEINVLIRNVGAKTKEESIGKFVLNTSDIKAQKKLDSVCFELDTLINID